MKKLINSFGFAIRGIFFVAKDQRNMRIHILAIALVMISGIYLGLSAIEWCAIILSIGIVISAEMFNTAIEGIVDFISPEHNRKAGRIKDIAAGAVLIAAATATIIALYVFGNKIFDLLF